MWLLILEALAALALLVFIVVWTMSGRRRTEEAPAEALAEPAPGNQARARDSKPPPPDEAR